MKQYEITFITKEPFDTAPSIKLGTSQGKDLKETPVKKEIEALGGKILNVSSIGQKNFTYPIKKEKAGFYTTVMFEIDPQKLMDLNKTIGLKEEILRHLIILYKAAKVGVPKAPKMPAPEKMLPKEEIKLPEPVKEIEVPKKETKVEEKVAEPKEEKKAAKKVAPKKVEPKVSKEADLSAVAPALPAGRSAKAEEIEKPARYASESVAGGETISEEERMKELDKKLDELLKE